MIKVNLLRSKVSTSSQEGHDVEGLAFDMAQDGSGANEKNIIIGKKVFLMSLAIVGLLLYESYVSDQLESQSKLIEIDANRLNTELLKLKKESGRAEEVEIEANKIEEKLKIIVELSKKRLRELKALDFLQSIIPDETWLTLIDYDGERVLFTGFAQSDSDLSKFVSRLEESAFFDEVLLVKSVKSTTKEGTVKSFELSSILGAGS